MSPPQRPHQQNARAGSGGCNATAPQRQRQRDEGSHKRLHVYAYARHSDADARTTCAGASRRRSHITPAPAPARATTPKRRKLPSMPARSCPLRRGPDRPWAQRQREQKPLTAGTVGCVFAGASVAAPSKRPRPHARLHAVHSPAVLGTCWDKGWVRWWGERARARKHGGAAGGGTK